MGRMTMQGLERSRHRVQSANRVLCWLLPVALLGAGADLSRWHSRVNAPLQPLAPSLEELVQPLPIVGGAGFAVEFFEQPAKPAPVAGPKAKEQAPVVQEAQWKLRGVLVAGGKRAFLEDEGGKGVWVTEGEQIGSTRIREIRERSVILEGKDGEYEIRM